MNKRIPFIFLWLCFATVSNITADSLLVKPSKQVADTVMQKKRTVVQKVIDYFASTNAEPKRDKFNFSIIGGPHYSSDTELGLGLVASGLYFSDHQDTLLMPSNVSLYADFSTVGFYMLGLRGNHIFPKDKYRFNYNLYFYSFPSYYWGIGYENASNKVNKESYNRFQAQVQGEFLYSISRAFYVGPQFAFDYVNATNCDKTKLFEGADSRTINYSLGFTLKYDTRDNLTAPYRGVYFSYDQKFSPSFLGNKYSFSSSELTFNYYRKVWTGGVVASQFHTLMNFNDPPWGLLGTLGGSYRMRGYYEGQYRDKCEFDTQVELRQHIYGRSGVAVWLGLGSVFPKISSLRSSQLLYNYGVGYRWEFKKRVNLRLDLGFGKDQIGFIFNINEAF